MKLSFAPTVVTNRLLGVGWVIVLAYLLILAVDSFVTDCTGDSCIFIYVAKGILQGDIPYLDRWDHKGPLLYFLNSIGLIIHEGFGGLLIQAFFLLGTCYFAFAALRNSFGAVPALLALALFLAFFTKFNLPGNFTEQYGLLFQFLTLYLFVRSEDQAKPNISPPHFASLHLGIGVLGAASFLLRPNLVALWIVIGLYWLFVRGNSLRKLAWAVFGGGSVLITVAGLFLVMGALDAFWDAVFVFNFAQSGASLQERLGVVRYLLTQMLPISLLVIASWFLGISCLIRTRVQVERFKGLLLVALILLPLEVVSLSLSGFEYRHYFLTALPVSILLLALFVWFVLEQRLIAPLLLSFALLFAAGYYASPLSNFERLVDKYGQKGTSVIQMDSPIAVRLRDLIQGATAPDDTILAWGKGAWIYLLSDRDAPTRFFYEVPLTKPNYTTQSIREEFFSDVKEQMPRLIIDMRHSRLPPLAPAERESWRSTGRYQHDPADFQPFFDFVDANYLAVDSTPPFIIYALRHNNVEIAAPEENRLIIRALYDVYLNGRTLTYVRRQCAKDDAAKRFILHVIPVDKSVIDGNEQHTMDFNFIEGNEWYVGESCVVSRELPDYAIAYIRTGQYDISRSQHEWLSEYHFSRPN